MLQYHALHQTWPQLKMALTRPCGVHACTNTTKLCCLIELAYAESHHGMYIYTCVWLSV